MRNVICAAAVVAALAACGQPEPAVEVSQSPAAMAENVEQSSTPAAQERVSRQGLAMAELKPTEGNQTSGVLHFHQVDGQLRVTGTISGLTPDSEHGFHIHETGDCSAADGSSAGGHFNPDALDHGSVDAADHHTGDMPNLKADGSGMATVDGPLSRHATLGDGGAHDIAGRGLIIHADPDDYASQPTGNAGARLACAVIQPGPMH